MKQQKHFILLVTSILIPFLLMAQKPLEIVVTVSDTINVAADRFSAIIEYTAPSMLLPNNVYDKSDVSITTISFAQFEKLTEASDRIRDESSEQNFLSSREIKQFVVQFDSFKKREKLTEQLMKYKNIRTNHLPPTSINKTINSRLIQKIIDTARTRATLLAKELDYKLGEIKEMEELSYGKSAGGWTSYPPLSMPNADGISADDNQAVISAKFKFRFAANRL